MVDRILAGAILEWKRGCYRDALRRVAAISRYELSTEARILHQVLSAELHQLTGDAISAEREARTLLGEPRVAPILACRAQNVLGNVASERGAFEEAVRDFRDALELAKHARDHEQIARTQLRLISVTADRNPDSVAGLWSEVRRNVLRAGEPQLAALLHLTQGRLEARRGLVDQAWRHLSLAQALLKDQPHEALEATLHLDCSALCAMSAELGLAANYARSSLEKARSSGHARTFIAALGNLGLIEATLGHFDVAEAGLKEALSLVGSRPETKAAFLDSYAQLRLLSGDTDACERLLRDAHQVFPRKDSLRPAWHEVSIYQTLVRLALMRGEVRQAVELATEAIRLADLRHDALLGLTFRTLKADALLEEGCVDEARTILEAVIQQAEHASMGVQGDIQRVLGKVLLRSGNKRDGLVHFGRGVRLLASVGGAWDKWTIAGDLVALGCAPPAQSDRLFRPLSAVHMPWSELTSGLNPPSIDSASIAASVSLVDLAKRPEALGRELIEYARVLKCASSLRSLCTDESGKRQVVSEWTEFRASPDGHGRTVSIDLGSSGSRKYSMELTPASGVEAQVTVSSLCRIVQAAVELEALRRREKERTSLWPAEVDLETGFGVFASSVMHELLTTVERVAAAPVTVLITGETGVGKELIAREVHRRSPNASAPFLPFNCASVPKDMLESQLFGYRRGAFTGAHDNFPGVIRSATNGTIFLDEIGELGLDVQPKLLRFMESSEVHPLGEPRPVKVDVRVVAATNVDLERLVREGRFREDLYYRVNGVCLNVPPLRERREEVPLLAEYFLDRYSHEMRKPRLRLSDEALEYLLLYRWPGNIRQLGNEIRRIVALAPAGGDLVPDLLSAEIRAARRTIDASVPVVLPGEVAIRLDQPLAVAVEQLERAMLQRALDQSDGRLEAAAERLGISRKGLFLKRRRLGLAE